METSNHEIVGESFNEIRDEITKIRQELRKYLEVWGNNRVVVQDSEKKKDCVDETDILKTHNYQTTFDGEIKAMAEDFNNKDVDSESEDLEVRECEWYYPWFYRWRCVSEYGIPAFGLQQFRR
ncbi:hypothetical protein ACFE04_029000 [Oxalis oulophora]